MSEKLPRGAILLKPRYYQELQDILDGAEVKEAMANAPRWFVTYSDSMPTGPIVKRDDDRHGSNDPELSERMRAEAGRLWTHIHTLYPTSGGSDGYFLTIHMPWEVEDVAPTFGYYNQDFMHMQPLSIYEVLDMYDTAAHEQLPAHILRFLQADPYATTDI